MSRNFRITTGMVVCNDNLEFLQCWVVHTFHPGFLCKTNPRFLLDVGCELSIRMRDECKENATSWLRNNS